MPWVGLKWTSISLGLHVFLLPSTWSKSLPKINSHVIWLRILLSRIKDSWICQKFVVFYKFDWRLMASICLLFFLWHPLGWMFVEVKTLLILTMISPAALNMFSPLSTTCSSEDIPRGGLLGLIFAGYVPLASQNPYPIIVYSVAKYKPHLDDPNLVTFCFCIYLLKLFN